MPRPLNELQSLEQEREELTVSLTADQRELEETPPQTRTRREFLVWRTRRVKLRLATIEATLAAIRAETR
jgi:hypothetical protein